MLPRGVVLGLAFTVFLASKVAATEITPDVVKAENARLRSHTWILRPSITTSVTYYVPTDSGQAYITRSRSGMFPLKTPEPVTTVDFTSSLSRATLELVSSRLGKDQILFFPPPGRNLNLEMIRNMLREVIDDPSSPQPLSEVVVDRESGMAHARGSNHGPPAGEAELFESKEAALASGYRLCPICFRATPMVSDYPTEKTLGDACSAEFRQFNPMVTDDSLNARVRRIGGRILDGWPVPLRGYEYHFYVVENEEPNAVACPTGAIFVTTGLLSAVESDAELEAVLAHEVAHVERRHGYRQYIRAKTSGTLGALFGAIAGVAIGAKTGDGEVAAATFDIIQGVSRVAAQIALAGYGRREEGEADSYALAYLGREDPNLGGAPMERILEKLQFSDAVNGIYDTSTGLFMTHPLIADRVERSKGATVGSIQHGTFGGYARDGRLLIIVRLECQSLVDYLVELPPHKGQVENYSTLNRDEGPRYERHKELQVFASVQAMPDLIAGATIDDVKILSGGRELKLDNKEDTLVPRGETVGMNFVMADAPGLLPDQIDGVKVKITAVDHWARLESDKLKN